MSNNHQSKLEDFKNLVRSGEMNMEMRVAVTCTYVDSFICVAFLTINNTVFKAQTIHESRYEALVMAQRYQTIAESLDATFKFFTDEELVT